MRNDLEEQGLYLQKLRPLQGRTPLLAMLFATYAAQTGNPEKAREYLEQPPFRTAFGGIEIARVLDRMPVAPAVRKKLRTVLKTEQKH